MEPRNLRPLALALRDFFILELLLSMVTDGDYFCEKVIKRGGTAELRPLTFMSEGFFVYKIRS